MTEDLSGQATQEAAPAYNYQPAQTAVSNYDAGVMAAMIEQMVNARLAQHGITPPPPELTPEEKARKDIDNRGVGLGPHEQFAQIWEHLSTLAKKVGV